MNFIITPKELNRLILKHDDIKIVDVRPKDDFLNAHIKGSIHIPEIFTYLPNGLTTQKEKKDFLDFFVLVLEKNGIKNRDKIIFYEEKYTLKSPRGLAILKYLGHNEEQIFILEGGFTLWEEENFEIDKSIVSLDTSVYKPNVQEDFFLDYNEMLEAIYDDDIIKLDVRDKDEWLGISSSPYGIDFAPKKGRLPNAIWIEWYNFITNDLLRANTLTIIDEILKSKNIEKDSNIVLYCFKGARLSNSYIALRELGYNNIRIYFAGWNEWCRIDNAPFINETLQVEDPLLKENIALKIKMDKIVNQNSKLISFPKYNPEPIFAFNREGNLYNENNSTRVELPFIKTYFDLFEAHNIDNLYNMIDNNETNIITVENDDNEFYELKIQGSREVNAVLVFGFNVTALKRLNENLEEMIVERTQELIKSNQQIKDSIEYASLIQGAVVSNSNEMTLFFKDHFVTWTPKDTVGGDIWLFNKLRHEDECLLMFIDCTGHGVPGAFVTMIVKSVEREIVSSLKKHPEFDISPAIIMAHFNKTMKTLLKQETKESLSNAGWDGGIIYYNRRTQILKFAGAETPLFYIDENREFKTVKGNRYSVGYKKCDMNYEYKETIIEVKEGMKAILIKMEEQKVFHLGRKDLAILSKKIMQNLWQNFKLYL